jgi:TDG/mug DNA glycosylase family protein
MRDARPMDRRTVEIYRARADEWIERRHRPTPVSLAPFAAHIPPGVRADLGSGPGWYSAGLGRPVLALDAALPMLERVPTFAPDAWRACADLERLPLRRGALTGAWAHKSYMHVPGERVPMALAELHRAVTLGGRVHLRVSCDQLEPDDDDPFAGRLFSHFSTGHFAEIVEGAGFEVDACSDDGEEWIDVEATRARMLADTVGPDMRLLLVGLNPSVYTADAGVGFARPGNRFWPAALAAGLVTRSHDAFHALRIDGVGMTNLVRRATPRADALTAAEYHAGAARLQRLVSWLEPRAVCFVGITGYRTAVDRRASFGWQPAGIGETPVYVMPNTSGLNAHAKPADFVEHLRAAQDAPT